MMRQTIALVLTLLSCNTLFARQGRAGSDAKLVHRYERACGYSCLQELAIELGGVHATKPDDKVAVRFCSKESLPVALTTAAASPEYLISILTNSYGYALERILFLRDKNCLGPDPKVTATEFWTIPQGAALPGFVESIRSDQVLLEAVDTGASSTKDTRKYKRAVQKLTAKLRERPGAVGVVLGYYYRSPSPVMQHRLREVRALLGRSGLSQDRYYVRLMPWTGERSVDPPEPEPKYPSLYVVEVTRDRD